MEEKKTDKNSVCAIIDHYDGAIVGCHEFGYRTLCYKCRRLHNRVLGKYVRIADANCPTREDWQD